MPYVNDPQFLFICPLDCLVDFSDYFLVIFRDVILKIDYDKCAFFHSMSFSFSHVIK